MKWNGKVEAEYHFAGPHFVTPSFISQDYLSAFILLFVGSLKY